MKRKTKAHPVCSLSLPILLLHIGSHRCLQEKSINRHSTHQERMFGPLHPSASQNVQFIPQQEQQFDSSFDANEGSSVSNLDEERTSDADATSAASSSTANLVAHATANRIIIRSSLPPYYTIHSRFSCVDVIDTISFSPDGNFILAALYKRSAVQAFSLLDHSWHCRINEGDMAGMIFATWSPDSRHIVTVSDFSLHLTIWSLVTNKSYSIKSPKSSAGGGPGAGAGGGGECIAFDLSGGELLAVLSRKNCQDHVSILSTETWKQVSCFSIATVDAQSILFSPSSSSSATSSSSFSSSGSRSIVVIDTSLEYGVYVYSLQGDLEAKYSAYDNALGVKASTFSPNGSFLALSSYDQITRLITPLSWKEAAKYSHDLPTKLSVSEKCKILNRFTEIGVEGLEIPILLSEENNFDHREEGEEDSSNGVAAAAPSSSFVPILPNALKFIKPNYSKANPKVGVSMQSWSYSSRYLCTRNDCTPSVAYIWDTQSLGLTSIIVFVKAIRSMRWSPKEDKLAIATGTNRLYMWSNSSSSAGATCGGGGDGRIEVADAVDRTSIKADDGGVPFEISALRWRGDGRCLAVVGRTAFCLYTLDDGDGDDGRGGGLREEEEGGVDMDGER
jgi:hypothetical protein